MGGWVYILRCADGAFYVGTTRDSLERRVAEHNAGLHAGYTARRRPVQLAYSEHFADVTDAIAAERQLKGWSRAKKQALIAGDFDRLRVLARGPRAATGRGP
jgi:putative endonuclease